MKTLLVLLLALAATPLQFDKTVHDFGEISIKDGAQKCEFVLTNTSDQDILILSVVTSCNCTTPSWTGVPIKPGDQGVICVEYANNEEPSVFNKTVTVYISGEQKPYVLYVRGKSTNKKIKK